MVNLLNIAQIIPSTSAEGPGTRFAIWLQGCSILCKKCCNPAMLDPQKGQSMAIDGIIQQLEQTIYETPDLDGISVLGGEPMDQVEGLYVLLGRIKNQHPQLGIMLYTGYTLEELKNRQDSSINGVLSVTDLLVDGPFIADQPETGRRWIGSDNQVMHFLTDRYSQSSECFVGSNTIEIRLINGELIVNGWPRDANALLKQGKL